MTDINVKLDVFVACGSSSMTSKLSNQCATKIKCGKEPVAKTYINSAMLFAFGSKSSKHYRQV